MYRDILYDLFDKDPYARPTPATEEDMVWYIWEFSIYTIFFTIMLLLQFADKEPIKGAVTPKSATKIGNAMIFFGLIIFVASAFIKNNILLFFSGPIATILIGYGNYISSFRKSKSSYIQKATKILAHALVIISFSAIVFQMYTYIFWDNPVFYWKYLIITIIVLIYLANRAFRKSYTKS